MRRAEVMDSVESGLAFTRSVHLRPHRFLVRTDQICCGGEIPRSEKQTETGVIFRLFPL